jgi:predicted DNA-binding antitoxin AbrB/MazE fold protein
VVCAVFEDGVLKPGEVLPLSNREQLQIAILPKAAWARALGGLLRRVHGRLSDLSPSEIEGEISLATRAARRSRRRRS